MTEYIEREAALSFPFANGLYDYENANLHFIKGCESYREWLEAIPFADVVARDCYDRLLVENDELRKERPVVRCKDCICFHPIGTSKYNGDCDKHYERVQCDDFCSWAEVEQDD